MIRSRLGRVDCYSTKVLTTLYFEECARTGRSWATKPCKNSIPACYSWVILVAKIHRTALFFLEKTQKIEVFVIFSAKDAFFNIRKKESFGKWLIATLRKVVRKIFSYTFRCVFMASVERWKPQVSILFLSKVIGEMLTALLFWTTVKPLLVNTPPIWKTCYTERS